jgi:hypothetical protein
VSTPGVDPRLLEVLGRASSLELFQLNSVIEVSVQPCHLD